MNRSTQIYTVIVIIILVIAGLFVFSKSADAPEESSQQATTQNNTTTNEERNAPSAESETQTFSRQQVAEHDKSDDCWTIIDGSVYNITDYISRHPGGNEIERACGIDASTLFNTRTTEEGERIGSGSGHSGSARAQLEQFKIGNLQQ